MPVNAPHLAFRGVRLGPYSYVEYGSGERELYDLSRDPGELRNQAGLPRYAHVEAFLRRLLARLKHCDGAGCKREAGPLPKPSR